MKKPATLGVTGFSLAQWEGFEPSSRFSGYTISNRARYDHFDTTAGHRRWTRPSRTAEIIIPDFADSSRGKSKKEGWVSFLQKGFIALGRIDIGQAAVREGGLRQMEPTGPEGGEEGIHPSVTGVQLSLEAGKGGLAVDAAGEVLPAIPGDGDHRLPLRGQSLGQIVGQLPGEEGDVAGDHQQSLRAADREEGTQPPQRSPVRQKVGYRGKAGQVVGPGAYR